MIPIEIVSHLARPLSLTVRLYANMFAGEQVTMVFLKPDLSSRSRDFHGPARFRLVPAGLYFHAADHDVCGRSRLRTNINTGFMPPFQCEPGCKRMTGTTSWGRFLKESNNDNEENAVPAGTAAARQPHAVRARRPNNPTANGHWVAISAGFAMAIASGLCGLAQAKAVAAAAEGMARNPGAAGAIRFALLLGLVLIESLALYTLVIIFVKVS